MDTRELIQITYLILIRVDPGFGFGSSTRSKCTSLAENDGNTHEKWLKKIQNWEA